MPPSLIGSGTDPLLDEDYDVPSVQDDDLDYILKRNVVVVEEVLQCNVVVVQEVLEDGYIPDRDVDVVVAQDRAVIQHVVKRPEVVERVNNVHLYYIICRDLNYGSHEARRSAPVRLCVGTISGRHKGEHHGHYERE